MTDLQTERGLAVEQSDLRLGSEEGRARDGLNHEIEAGE